MGGKKDNVSLSETAMIWRIKIGLFRGVKVDPSAANVLAAAAEYSSDAKEERFKGTISLVDPAKVRPLIRWSDECRKRFKEMSLPWLDDGARLIAAHALDRAKEFEDEMAERFDELKRDLVKNWDDIKAEGIRSLGSTEDAIGHLYPDSEDLKNLVRFESAFTPIADSSDIRLRLSDAQKQRIIKDTEAAHKEALRAAQHDAWKRVHDEVSRLAHLLSDPGEGERKMKGGSRYFTPAAQQRLEGLVDVLDAINLTDDPDLTKAASQLRQDLLSHDTTELQEDTKVRHQVQKKAEKIKTKAFNKMSAFSWEV